MTDPRHDRPLRVLMLIPYDLHYQPFTIRSSRFAEELVRRGHEVRLRFRTMRPSKRGRLVHRDLPAGCDVSPLPRLSRPSGWRQLADDVRWADVVHFQKSRPPLAQAALLLGRRYGKPIHQDWDDDELAFWRQASRDAWSGEGSLPHRALRSARALVVAALTGSMEWLIPKVADTVGGASIYLREKAIRWGAAPSRTFPARVGVDADRFHPDRHDEALRAELGLTGPTVLFAGSFDVHPDLLFFAAALRELLRAAPDAQALVVGGGFGRERLSGLLGDGLPPRAVVMTGGLVPFDEMPRYVASADIAALPFRDTPVNRCKSSLTMMECMASGLPVVTHDVGDAGWILGEGGVVVATHEPAAFGAALAELARDPSRRRSLGERGRSRAATQLGWARSVDHLEMAYRRAVADRAAAPHD